jgi:hypothetical protein
MEREGPPLEALLQRLADAPEEFLMEPKRGKRGQVDVTAVVFDLLSMFGDAPEPSKVRALGESGTKKSLAVTLLLCWLIGEEAVTRLGPTQSQALELLDEGAKELAKHTAAKVFTSDVERREEMARFALKRLGLRPRGESEAQADDRLTSLSAAERARVLEASRAAEERARVVREALAKKAAEESADKWTRE